MLEPGNFEQGEAWVVFQLNDAPVRTAQDGDFNCIALMDAASGHIFGTMAVAVAQGEPSAFEVRRLFDSCLEGGAQVPSTLLIPKGQFGTALPAEAERRGITAAHVHEANLAGLTSPATQSFREHVQRAG